MAKATILFADNDLDFIRTRSEFLEQEGYLTVPAANLTEARRKLELGSIDLAIIDIRLNDDDDEKDISGLSLAREVARAVPKIILTGFPSYEYVRQALKPQLTGWPVAIDFVTKQEGPEALVQAIQCALDRPLGAWKPAPAPQEEESLRHKQLAQLRQNLVDSFSDDELRTLCFDLGVDYDTLPSGGKEGTARELVAYLERRRRLLDLIDLCRQRRPNVLWELDKSHQGANACPK